MAKNSSSKNIYGKAEYNEELLKTIKIAAVVILFIGIIYFITALITGEISFKKETKPVTEVKIQYDEIIAGEVLNRSEKEYYVLTLNFTNDYASAIMNSADNYAASSNVKIYNVDLDKAFNNAILAGEEKYETTPSKISKLKVKNNEITLLKIKDGKVTKRIETYETIKDYLSE